MASYVITLPNMQSQPSSSSSTPPRESVSEQKTNSLIVTGLPQSFFHPQILGVLRHHFEVYGAVNQWVPLPGFGRIIVVYYEEDRAEEAKRHSDPIILAGTEDRSQVILRVYRIDSNPILSQSHFGSVVPESNLLRPPALDKNFLISPPGSPPVGWEPVREEPPNASPLADDLIAALKRLQTSSVGRNDREVLLDPKEGSGVGVYVQNCDGDDDDDDVVMEDDWVYGETAPARERWRHVPMPTAMPPMRSTIVM